MNRSRARQLNLSYTYDDGFLYFDDGVRYSLKEALHLTSAADEDIRAIHAVKRAFHGELLTDPPITPRYRPICYKKDEPRPELQPCRNEEDIMDTDFSRLICPDCCGNHFIMSRRGPHVGVFCDSKSHKRRWMAWVSIDRAIMLDEASPRYRFKSNKDRCYARAARPHLKPLQTDLFDQG